MGKSPEKWIKTLLLGKKPSNLNSANKAEVLVSSKVTLSELLAHPPSISSAIPVNSASDFVDSKKGTPKLLNNGTNIPSSQAVGNDNTISIFGKPVDPERLRLDRAAAKAQAAIRGYLVCRAFRTLKGIIRLQALVHGHLVGRQAVATLGVAASAHGKKVRCLDIDIEMQEKHIRLPLVFFFSYKPVGNDLPCNSDKNCKHKLFNAIVMFVAYVALLDLLILHTMLLSRLQLIYLSKARKAQILSELVHFLRVLKTKQTMSLFKSF